MAAPPGWNAFVGGGAFNKATGDYSAICGGQSNKASGSSSYQGGGYENVASGAFSTVPGGRNNLASDSYTTVGGGRSNTANDLYSTVAGGRNNLASGVYSTVSGGIGNTGTGSYSFVSGLQNTAQSYGESVMGFWATIGEGDSLNFNPADRLFVLGNGTGYTTRSNAITILKNANTTIGGTLTINANVTSTGYTFPAGRGSSGQLLQTDGSGNTNWVNAVITYQVGDFAQGGIVYWVDETGQHGLVCAKEDQDGGSGIQWNNGTNIYTESTGNGIYAGEMNTTLIIANQGHDSNDYAAGICANLEVTIDGILYGDWYLPSSRELYRMYQNKAAIDATATANGGSIFTTEFYWSSRENNLADAIVVDFGAGQGFQDIRPKSDQHRVRAIRSF